MAIAASNEDVAVPSSAFQRHSSLDRKACEGKGSPSKQDLQRELHVEGFTGADAGRAVKVSCGVAALPESAADGTAGRRQVDAVEQIEKLDAQLGAQSFRDRNVLENRKINVAESRSIDGIARYGSERILCRVGVCVWMAYAFGLIH